MEWLYGPKGTLTRWVGTAAIVIGIIVAGRSTDVYPEGHGFVVGLAIVGGGLLLRIESAIVVGLAERREFRTRERVLPYDDAGD